MVGWHHRLNGPEFEQAPSVGDGQGGLACCSPWGRKESDTLKKRKRKWVDQGGRSGGDRKGQILDTPAVELT